MIGYLENKRKIALIFTVLMVLEIFFFSSVKGGTTGTGNIWIPRAYHFIAFFLLNFFMIVSIKGNKKIYFYINNNLFNIFYPRRNTPDICSWKRCRHRGYNNR
jgi:hypothetical protein